MHLDFALNNQKLRFLQVGSQIYVPQSLPMTLIAYFLRVPLWTASLTLPKDPTPSSRRNRNSEMDLKSFFDGISICIKNHNGIYDRNDQRFKSSVTSYFAWNVITLPHHNVSIPSHQIVVSIVNLVSVPIHSVLVALVQNVFISSHIVVFSIHMIVIPFNIV